MDSAQRFDSIELLGMQLARLNSTQLVDHVFERLREGQGGWIVTANLDIVRRYVLDSDARTTYGSADLRVADGMPLVWASRLRGAQLPERVAGSSLSLTLAARAAQEQRSIYLLGGAEGAAAACAGALQQSHPELEIVGTSNPWVGNPATIEEVDEIEAEIRRRGVPDIVLVGLGSPKQEYLIQKLRQRFPASWFMGVGITFSFVAGQVQRAPQWMQRTGVEWIHRMVQEPDRLVKRYLIDDLPFAALLFGEAIWNRLRAKQR